MLLSFRLSTIMTAYVLALALCAVPSHEAFAQSGPVQTYVDQAVPSSTDGILPDGMAWNHPLKAGDMVLPRSTKPKAKDTQKTKTPKAVDELKAPQLSSAQAQAPKLSSQNKSAASLMLMQGMKSALQKAGQNPDIPKPDLVPVENPPTSDDPSKVLAVPAKANTVLTAPRLQAPTVAASAPVALSPDSPYVGGQEPKGWIAPDGTLSHGAASAPLADNGDTQITFPPEMTAGASDASAPKATEIAQEPVPLEEAMTAPAKTEEKEDNHSFFDRLTSPFTSIFGEPVKEGSSEKRPASAAAASTAAKADGCEPKIEKWTRECGDAGYPAHFVGQIVGESRTNCATGEIKDVWLSNTCAAPIGSSPLAVQDKSGSVVDQDAIAQSSAKAAASSQAVLVETESKAAVDGACGVANGLAADAQPAGDLCAAGQATAVSGEGPWRWSCTGLRGGMTVSCAAPVAQVSATAKKNVKEPSAKAEFVVEDGLCGVAAKGGVDTAPVADLCEKGSASNVNGEGPWTWACSGLNGGAAAACTANKKTDGACGAANDIGTDSMPMRDLCTAGYASAVTGSGPWNWSCSGLYGGAAATCSAPLTVNAVCGPASMKGFGETPRDGLCSVGTASDVSGDGPWSWSCKGSHGGASVTCDAAVKGDGVCGPAHGNRYAEAPKVGLCNQGAATRVTGLGPWNWNCSGSNGGATATCTAALASKEEASSLLQCGKAAETLAFAAPSEDLCVSGKASDVSGEGPWTWSCSDEAGHTTSCSTLTASDGVCGKAANAPSKDAPSRNLCDKGTPGDVTMVEKTSWQWVCQGSMGASSSTCTAPLTSAAAKAAAKAEEPTNAEAQCGNAAGVSVAEMPESDLCEIGKASTVRGHGPWTWTCGTKTKVSCEAPKLANGQCGVANGSVQKSIPTSGLCATGAATEVSGNGPWMWSCVGAGGGSSSSCSASSYAQTRVDGVCGAAANAVTTALPAANLCDSGSPSTVYGDGPWTWTCSGMNGGIASTCSSSKVVPKAPPPPGPAVNGLCGYANGVAAESAPDDGLCTSGTPTALSGQGPWNWGCIGANGGMTVSCTAPLVPPPPIVGACGGASGVPTLTTPKSGLCSAGISSAVSGKGPWTWSCSGTNGGGAVSCVAPLAGTGAASQGIPSMVTPTLESAEAPSPKAAPVGLVTPQLPAGPLPALKSGEVPTLKSSKALSSKASKKAVVEVPEAAPDLPEGMQGINPPPLRDEAKPPAGIVPPVLDSEGKPVPGARLVLDPDLTTISFDRASDQMDKDAVDIVEKITKVLLTHPSSRITLISYSDTGGDISPREARRLSLNRALAIRDFMTAKGVPSSRVDVRPMGANVPSGDMDRVDVKVN